MFNSIGIPHGFCFLWNPGLLWLHVLSDSLIALAYFLIPLVLLRIARRRTDLPHMGILLCFGAFIIACGITHVLEVVTLWHPVYWISGTMKAITAIVSLATLILLARLAPDIIALPSSRSLDEANRRLNLVLDSTTASVCALDQDLRYTYLNGNARRVTAAQGDLIGRRMTEVYPNQNPETLRHFQQVMKTGKPIEFESYYEPMDFSTKLSVSPSGDGGLTVFFTDISEQKRLARQLHVEQALREQRIRALAHMAGGLAHEISNPLGIIHARASNIMEMLDSNQVVDTQVVAAACESIVKTADRAMRTLQGLRNFAREGSDDPLVPTPIGPLLQRTIQMIQHRFSAHRIELTADLPAQSLSVPCRTPQIEQAVLNLLNNAFDAVHDVDDDCRWIRIYVTTNDLYVMIHVMDGGRGVPAEHRPYLMTPFFTTKPMGGGIGISLSLSQAIAHEHGGSLVLADEPHTCFRLTLPRTGLSTKGTPHDHG